MSMSKKDFIKLAEQLAIVRRRLELCEIKNKPLALEVWQQCVNATVLACRSTSANFDSEKFRQATRI